MAAMLYSTALKLQKSGAVQAKIPLIPLKKQKNPQSPRAVRRLGVWFYAGIKHKTIKRRIA